MTWQVIDEYLLGDDWIFTPPVEGRFFRVIPLNDPSPLGRAKVAQSKGVGGFAELLGAVDLSSPVIHVLEFEKPPFWQERRIALRKNRRGHTWHVRLEVSDIDLSPLPHPPTSHPPILGFPAARSLSALRVVRLNPGNQLDYASSLNPDHAHSVAGVLPTAIDAGLSISPSREGTLSDSSWSWDTSRPIFLGIDGILTQVAPNTGFILQVAVPLTPNLIYVDIQEPILL